MEWLFYRPGVAEKVLKHPDAASSLGPHTTAIMLGLDAKAAVAAGPVPKDHVYGSGIKRLFDDTIGPDPLAKRASGDEAPDREAFVAHAKTMEALFLTIPGVTPEMAHASAHQHIHPDGTPFTMNEGMEASEHRRKDTGEPAHTAESVKASISQLADLVNLQTLNQPPVCKPAKTKASRK